MGRILLLGASEIQVPAIQAAKRKGHHVLVADFNPAAPGLALADTPLLVSTNDVEAVFACAVEHGVQGIATTSDFPVRTVAEVSARLGFPALSHASASVCTDKFRQRELMAAAGLATPWFFRLEPSDSPEAVLPPSWPLVVKPVDSSASRGVSKVDGPDDYSSALELARSNSRSGAVIVEEFLEGREFSVEVVCQGGAIDIVAITAKTTSGDGGKFFVETQHVVPADLEEAEAASIRLAVEQAVKACGLDNSAAHVEVMSTPKGPMLIEMAARLGGDYITSDLVPLATGVDMLGAVIDIAMGIKADRRRSLGKFAGIQFITPDNHQRALIKISNLANDPRIVRRQILPKPKSAMLRSSMDRLGYWIAQTDSRSELFEILDADN
jgi:biotin carboxylase